MATKPLELQSLKWPFVGLAVLLALCTGWAVYDEVFPRRPWKAYQRDFFDLEKKHLEADLARAGKRLEEADVKAKREALRKELQEATAAISGNPEQRRAYDAAAKADDDARVKEAEAKLYLGFDKSYQDNVYYELREARHDEDAKREAELQKKYDEWQRKIDAKQRAYEAAIAQHQQTSKARATFQARKDKAQASLDAMEKPLEELKKRIDLVSGKWPQMEQYWVQDLKNSWGGPTVDRCQNCHVAVNKGGFSAPWEVLEARKNKMPDADMKAQFALDPEVIDAYQTVHDKICEDLPPATAAIPPGGWQPPAPPQPMDPASATECRPGAAYQRWLERAEAYCGPHARWLAKTKTVLKDKKGGVLALTEADYKGVSRNPAEDALRAGEKARTEDRVAQACTDKDTLVAFEEADKADLFDVKPVFRTHPSRWTLLVQNHVPENVGCTVCHGGEGMQTKGVEHKAFRHGEDDHYWNDPLTDEVTVMGRKYKGAFLQAKCDQCHYQQLNVDHAPVLAKGKKLFVDVGCWGCHPIEGYNDLAKRGPTLTNIASKTTPGWLHTWISYPKGWRPATRMPNFWPGSVSADAVPHPEGMKPEQVVAEHRKVREQEVAQIAAYLWTTGERGKLLATSAPNGDAAKGKQLFDSVGCRGCPV